MVVLAFVIPTAYSADELQAIVEQALADATKIIAGKRPYMLEPVSRYFEDLKQIDQLLGKTQDVLRRDHGIFVDLTGAPQAERENLSKGSFMDCALWIDGRIAKQPLAHGAGQ